MRNRLGLGLLIAALWCGAAHAERWLKIDPNDPYSDKGVFHWFDIDSAYEDPETGWVYSWGAFKSAPVIEAGAVQDRFLWVFDCVRNQVRMAGHEKDGGFVIKENWRADPDDLAQPHMGGVTNLWGRKLCALKGSWPKKALVP